MKSCRNTKIGRADIPLQLQGQKFKGLAHYKPLWVNVQVSTYTRRITYYEVIVTQRPHSLFWFTCDESAVKHQPTNQPTYNFL